MFTCAPTSYVLARALTEPAGAKTQLIVASIREWQTLVRVAGCDVFTVPCNVLGEFLSQTDVPLETLTSQLETSYEDRLGIAEEAIESVGQQHIARLWLVEEPEFLEFLVDYRTSAEYRELGDGERLRRRFERSGLRIAINGLGRTRACQGRASRGGRGIRHDSGTRRPARLALATYSQREDPHVHQADAVRL